MFGIDISTTMYNVLVGVKNDRMMTTLLKVMVFIKICNKCIKAMNL